MYGGEYGYEICCFLWGYCLLVGVLFEGGDELCGVGGFCGFDGWVGVWDWDVVGCYGVFGDCVYCWFDELKGCYVDDVGCLEFGV